MNTRKIFLLLFSLLVFLLPLSQVKIFASLPLYLPEIATLATLIIFLWSRKKGWPSISEHRLDSWFGLGTLLFLFGALFSLLANPLTLTGFGMLKTWFAFPALAAWLLFQWQPDDKEKKTLLLSWLFSTLLVALATISYVFQGVLTYDGRLAAWFLSPNYLAIFIVPGILIAFAFLCQRLNEKKTKEILFFFVNLVILLGVLYLTKSYGAWLAVFGGLILTSYFSFRNKKFFWKMLFFLGFLGGAFFFSEHDEEKWQTALMLEERSSMASRMMIWRSAGKMIADNPVFGIGPGRFQEVYLEYQKYFPPYLEWAVPQPHNIALAVWLQTGLLGLIGFVILVVRAIQILLQNKNRETGLLLGMLGLYLLYGLFDTPYFKTDLAFAFWLVIALAVCFTPSSQRVV